MTDKLYLYSIDWGDGPELIGTITKNGGDYKFSYANPDNVKWYQVIKPYTDTHKVYRTNAVKPLFRRLIPEENDYYTLDYLKQYSMEKYDEWELLTRFVEDSHISFGKPDCTGNIYWATKLSSC